MHAHIAILWPYGNISAPRIFMAQRVVKMGRVDHIYKQFVQKYSKLFIPFLGMKIYTKKIIAQSDVSNDR